MTYTHSVGLTSLVVPLLGLLLHQSKKHYFGNFMIQQFMLKRCSAPEEDAKERYV